MKKHSDMGTAVAESVPLTQRFEIEGMNCASCVRRVENAIAAVPGVGAARVNLATETAEVVLKAPGAEAAVVEAIDAAGYGVRSEVFEVSIGGLTCAGCVRRVEGAIASVPGVLKVTVNLATERARVTALPGTDRAGIEASIRKAGYQPSSLGEGQGNAQSRLERKDAEYAQLKRDVLIAAALTLPVFLAEMGSHLVPAIHIFIMDTLGGWQNRILQAALTAAVLLGPGLRFFRAGVPALVRLAPDMSSLIALGTFAAWAYSVAATVVPFVFPAGTANVYFESACLIVTLILTGRLIEARAKGRTSEAIGRLIGLEPKTARVEREGKLVDLAIEALVAGDIVHVRPGQRLPADGTIVSGETFVDESMITGEPVPVAKSKGGWVAAGTINGNGSFSFRAEKVGRDTMLRQIIALVEAAQGGKLPIQANIDRVAQWFVPAVMAVAALTFIAWLTFGPEPSLSFALVNAVAVLIIACPCAMGLATPTSIMVGTGRAAALGILFRKGAALQTLRDVDVVAFDKTGTLTEGRPALTDLVVVEGFERDDVLALAAAVERGSEHPIAASIVAGAIREGLVPGPAEGFEAMPGYGARATVGGRKVAVGADRLMARLGLDVTVFAAQADRLGREGKSPLYAAVDGKLAAMIAVADPVKASSAAAIQALRALGLQVTMITGDDRRTADALAARLGIKDVFAEVLPGGKGDVVRRLKSGNRNVAFVGDGINDAPALAEADTGIAVGTGTDVAIESADVVLVSGDLKGVANAIALSKATLANIRQNLVWAFGYNVVLVPVAAGALYPFTGMLLSPVLAAAAMALSSVFVLGNALRLRAFAPPFTGSRRAGIAQALVVPALAGRL